MILGLIALCLVIVRGVSVVVSHHRAVAAADLVALSAATVIQSDTLDRSCAVASQIAESNGAGLTDCRAVDGQDVPYGVPGETGILVKVTVSGQHAEAAAGPVGSPTE